MSDDQYVHFNRMQREIVDVGAEVFGRANMINPHERALRFFEEACELGQACGLSDIQMMDMIRYVTGREPGHVDQELAGVGLTLFALADARGYNLHGCLTHEVKRVLAKKDQCRAKHASKPAHIVAV